MQAAVRAFDRKSEWKLLSASQRGRLINRLADLVERDSAYIAVSIRSLRHFHSPFHSSFYSSFCSFSRIRWKKNHSFERLQVIKHRDGCFQGHAGSFVYAVAQPLLLQ